jgi:hypothetical protein
MQRAGERRILHDRNAMLLGNLANLERDRVACGRDMRRTGAREPKADMGRPGSLELRRRQIARLEPGRVGIGDILG